MNKEGEARLFKKNENAQTVSENYGYIQFIIMKSYSKHVDLEHK